MPGDFRFSARALLFLLQLAAAAIVVVVTNHGMVENAAALAHGGRWLALATSLLSWTVGLAALLIAMLLPTWWLRLFWALTIALSTSAGFAFYIASRTELTIFDVVSLWGARREFDHAFAFYRDGAIEAALAFVAMFVLIALPPPPMREASKRWLRRLALAPALPIVLYAVMISGRDGYAPRTLPTQFEPVVVAAATSIKVAASPVPQREAVPWRPGPRMIKHVVVLVDESVRADFIDFRPGNLYTPEIARLKDRFINFGYASSGGNCSSYSNAILRFGPSRRDLTRTILRNPSLWRFAKAAGYRTVFIDAQVATWHGKDRIYQNFMSAQEAEDIDDFHALASEPIYSADDRLMDIIVKELRSDQPTFIYAVKNGAHFPYEPSYPAEAAAFKPTISERGASDVTALVNSYRNAIKWSVDRVLKRMIEEADLKDAAVIYTSDHGQNLSGVGLTHCTVDKPFRYEGLVPLLAVTENEALRARLTAAAEKVRGHASHFKIAPTVLRLFGYAQQDLATHYDASLFEPDNEPTAFASGDIFGLVSSDLRWCRVDLTPGAPDNGERCGAPPAYTAQASERRVVPR